MHDFIARKVVAFRKKDAKNRNTNLNRNPIDDAACHQSNLIQSVLTSCAN